MILLAESEGPYQTADAQADLGLCCPHMPKDTFLLGAAHVVVLFFGGGGKNSTLAFLQSKTELCKQYRYRQDTSHEPFHQNLHSHTNFD